MENQNETPESTNPETSGATLSQPPLIESLTTPAPPVTSSSSTQPKRSHHKKKEGEKKGNKGPRFKPSNGAPISSNESGSDQNPGPQSKNGPSSKESTSENSFFAKAAYTAAQKKAMAKKSAEYLQTGSIVVSQRVLRDPVELENGLFIMTEEESVKIATPAVSILARHQIGGEVLGDTDISDAIALGLAFVNYISQNLKDRQVLRNRYASTFTEQERGDDPGQEVRSSPAESVVIQPENESARDIDPEAERLSQMNYLAGFVRPGLQR